MRSLHPYFTRTGLVLFSLLGVLFLTACQSGEPFLAPQPQQKPAFEQTYRLGPGDTVTVTVFNEEQISGEYKIDTEGEIDLPLAGNIKLTGLTVKEAKDRLENILQEGYLIDPDVSLGVESFRPFYILGEVGAPGAYAYESGITVLKAAALAGGFTYRAENRTFKIVRKGKDESEVIPADIHAPVFPGDTIYVSERLF